MTRLTTDPPERGPQHRRAHTAHVDEPSARCHDDRVSTGGTAGHDQGRPENREGRPSVTTLLPPLARLRLALAGVQPRQVLGATLVLLWAAWLIALWVTQPRLVPPDRLDEDLAQGRVTEYAVVVLREDRSGMFDYSPSVEVWPAPDDSRGQLAGAGLNDLPSSDGTLTIAYWVDTRVADLRVLDPDRTSPENLRAVADRLDGAGVDDRTATSLFLVSGDGLRNLLAVLMLVGLVVVITGPRPGRGNRWFWFWVLGLPLGLGLLALAVLEFLRPPRLVVVPETARGDDVADGDVTASEEAFTPKRLSGWAGFWINILGAILVTVVVDQLADLMPLLFLRA